MKQADYELVKLFFNRLTADDFQRRAESKQQAQQMMYSFAELIEELDRKQIVKIEREA